MKIINFEEIVEKDDLYFCGSPNLKKFLEGNGIVSISSYTKKNTNKDIFIYIKSNKVKELLTIWSHNKKERSEDDE